MSKKSAPQSRRAPRTPKAPKTSGKPSLEWFAKSADPAQIFDAIERESDGVPGEDAYRTRIEALMEASWQPTCGDVDIIHDAQHLRETSGGLTLTEASRRTGFVLGFEYCRQLLFGELDLAALKGGAA